MRHRDPSAARPLTRMMRGMAEALRDLTADTYRAHAITDYMRWLSCRYLANDAFEAAADLFAERWPDSLHRDVIRKGVMRHKAATAAGNTTDPSWAAPLVPTLSEPFIALVHSQALLGRLQGLRRVPFQTAPAVQTTPGQAYWVAQGARKPITKFGFAGGAPLTPTKAAEQIVVTQELLRLAVPGTEAQLRDELGAELVAFLDGQMLDPAVAAVADKNPASLTNGIAPIASGATIDDTLAAVLASLFASRPAASSAVIIVSPANASKLAGSGKNQNARADGGTVQGVALVPSAGAGPRVIALDPAGVLVAEGGLAIDSSDKALVEQNDAPTGGASGVVSSAWQLGLTVIRAEMQANWRGLTGAVAWAVA